VLNVKMKYLETWTAKRREFSALYREHLSGSRVQMPQDSPGSDSVYHLFVAYVDERDKVRDKLAEFGVQTAVHYPIPVHRQAAFQHLGYAAGSLPHTERACERVLSMPLFPEMSADQVEYAAKCLVKAAG